MLPTTNAAERALRPSVIFRKVANGLTQSVPSGHRSTWGANVHALVRSVIGTGRLHGLTAHQAILQILAGQPILV